MIYLLLFAGVFMGWSLGTNDAANAFGTAVSTGVIKYRTAVIIIAVMVIAGAFLMGEGNIGKVNDLAVINDVSASEEKVAEAEAADLASGTDTAMKELRLKSALKAFIVFTCAAVTVFIMSYLGFPVSANQSITGAIVGWGLFHANYSDPIVRGPALSKLGQFASTWMLNPLGATNNTANGPVGSYVNRYWESQYSEAYVGVQESHLQWLNNEWRHYDDAADADGNPILNENTGKQEVIETFYFDGEETDEELFKDLYQVIIGAMFSKISDDWDIQGVYTEGPRFCKKDGWI